MEWLDSPLLTLRVTRWLEKSYQIFQRIAQKVAKSKKGHNIYNKAQFENPKHLHQTTFKTLKYLQQTMFWNCLLRKNVINLLKQKVAQKAFQILSKNHNEPPKVAQLAKNRPIWSPWLSAKATIFIHRYIIDYLALATLGRITQKLDHFYLCRVTQGGQGK
jgi:hypothetical protein